MSETISDERQTALVPTTDAEQAFGDYAATRDKWLATPYAHNTTLAKGGYLFTIIDATQRVFEATELDTSRGYAIGDPIDKIAYLCVSQQDWWHYSVGEEDKEYLNGEMFVILFNVNPVRIKDLERITRLLEEGGEIHNICLQEYPNRVKGRNPAHGLVTAAQWKSPS